MLGLPSHCGRATVIAFVDERRRSREFVFECVECHALGVGRGFVSPELASELARGRAQYAEKARALRRLAADLGIGVRRLR